MSKAYLKKVKDMEESFQQNAASVQEMVNGVESEIFALLKKKEKMREKINAANDDKRLHPAMPDRVALLLDDVADFANLYNLRQPPETLVSQKVKNTADRPVIGEAPKVSRQIIIEMNPADVIDQSPTSPSGSPSASPSSASPNASSPSPQQEQQQQQQQPESPGFENASPQQQQKESTINIDQPSCACSLTVSFSPLKAPVVSSKSKSASSAASSAASTPAATAATAASGGGTPSSTTSSSSSSSSQQQLSGLPEIEPGQLPVLAVRFRLMLPPATSPESIRQKLQEKVDSHLLEIRKQLETAHDAFTKAVDEEESAEEKEKEKAEKEEKKKKEGGGGGGGEDTPKLEDVSDLYWKSIRLYVSCVRGPVTYQATTAVVTVYVYQILTEEQKAKKAALEKKMEQKLDDAIKEAAETGGADGDEILKDVNDVKKSRAYRQLCSVARLCADTNVSSTLELQLTAQPKNKKLGAFGSPTSPTTTTATSAATNTSSPTSEIEQQKQQAEDVLQRVLDSAPRVEGAIQEAIKAYNEASSTSIEEVQKLAVGRADAFYRSSLLPAIQRNVDPEDKVVNFANTLIPSKDEKFENSEFFKKQREEEDLKDEAPFVMCLNGHHFEVNNLPKQLVRQTANMMYDYFLDKTSSISGRAYIAMCRRRTLAGLSLYDALHFNILPLPQSKDSEVAKSACAFYHSEKLMRAAVTRMANKAVEMMMEAKEKISKAMDSSGSSPEGYFVKGVASLRLAMRIGKRLFQQFREERAQEEEERRKRGEASGDERTNAFAFVKGQVCMCDEARPLEVDVYMPDSEAICTFKLVLRPAIPEFLSPRIRPQRKDKKNAAIQAATMTAAACRGKCTTTLPEFGLQIFEAFARVWIRQINSMLEEQKEEREKKAAAEAEASATAASSSSS